MNTGGWLAESRMHVNNKESDGVELPCAPKISSVTKASVPCLPVTTCTSYTPLGVGVRAYGRCGSDLVGYPAGAGKGGDELEEGGEVAADGPSAVATGFVTTSVVETRCRLRSSTVRVDTAPPPPPPPPLVG